MVSRLICSFTITLMMLAAGLTPAAALAQGVPQTPNDAAVVGQSQIDQAQTGQAPASPQSPPAVPTIDSVNQSVASLLASMNTLWVLIAASLVFIMNLGFGCVESGLTRAKNTTNILFKNSAVPCIGVLGFAFAGFGLMYPIGGSEGHWLIPGWLGFEGFGLYGSGNPNTPDFGVSYLAYFLFQAMFAATAATIVSGAVAERIKLSSFLVFTVVLVLVAYPITGSWIWATGGWLFARGFIDFAGSTAVHSVGGWGALVGAIMVGPRLGKYAKDGTSNAIPGHNLGLAMIGVFMLWWGWFGFNGGSGLKADPGPLSSILVVTVLGACAGGLTAMLTSWILQKKPDYTMLLNGILAGLVAITAGCANFSPLDGAIVGGLGGIMAVFAVLIVDQKLRIDDPVGAISVHLVNGVWGTLACGIFGSARGFGQLGIQLMGIVAVGVFTVAFCIIVWSIIKAVMGMRVSDEEQIEGLDLGEHDQAAYPDFQQTHIKSYHSREA